jgi:hypothetical protein
MTNDDEILTRSFGSAELRGITATEDATIVAFGWTSIVRTGSAWPPLSTGWLLRYPLEVKPKPTGYEMPCLSCGPANRRISRREGNRHRRCRALLRTGAACDHRSIYPQAQKEFTRLARRAALLALLPSGVRNSVTHLAGLKCYLCLRSHRAGRRHVTESSETEPHVFSFRSSLLLGRTKFP